MSEPFVSYIEPGDESAVNTTVVYTSDIDLLVRVRGQSRWWKRLYYWLFRKDDPGRPRPIETVAMRDE